MKAILVIDMPDNINVDKMCKTPVSLTFQLQSCKQIMYEDGYLRLMLQKKDLRDYAEKIGADFNLQTRIMDYMNGYNKCIDEILGEEE